MMRRWSLLFATALLGLAGCSSFHQNPILKKVELEKGYRLENIDRYPHPSKKNSEKTFFVLTLSGGGTRAAALAFGVMKHLQETKIRSDRSVLDEVDVISSVSGGSFAAAFYGAFGEEIFFQDFRKVVLDRKIQSSLIRRVLSPWNWPRLWSPKFGRSDLLNEFYDRKIFGGKTYANMPRKKPVIILNSTDMSLGAQFSFIQEHFDRLCSDLDGVQVSRAVISSSAFPGAFTPLTFDNHNKSKTACGYVAPT